jgi:hypothetical protein
MAQVNVSTFYDGQVVLTITTTGANLSNVNVANNSPGTFVFQAFSGQSVIWSYTQAPFSTGDVVPPALGWTVGKVTSHNSTFQTITAPPWQMSLNY